MNTFLLFLLAFAMLLSSFMFIKRLAYERVKPALAWGVVAVILIFVLSSVGADAQVIH